jgi:hypothetical protein
MITFGVLLVVLSPVAVATWLLSWWLFDGDARPQRPLVPARARVEIFDRSVSRDRQP